MIFSRLRFWIRGIVLDKTTSLWYNRETETRPVAANLPSIEDLHMDNTFNNNPRQAKIQGLSVQVGELFADLYKDNTAQDEAQECLEAYKSLRRLLPRETAWTAWPRVSNNRHIGACAAHKATQGVGT
jgi:hypothetical protein